MGQQVVHLAQDALVTLQSRQPAKHLRHDQHRKVPGAVRRSSVADVVGPIVVNLQHRRRQRFEAVAQRGGNGVQDASPGRWRDSQTPWARTKTRNRPIPPQTLKLTHVSVG